MHSITITYHPSASTSTAGGSLRRTLPERWSELTPEQAWHCMDLIIRGVPRWHIAEYLLQLPHLISDRIGDGQRYDLIEAISWMDLDPALPEPIAPYIVVSGVRLYLCTSGLEYMTCREYMLIDDVHSRYDEEQTEELELRLIALMLRPAGPSPYSHGDPRVLLQSEHHTEEWIHLVRQLPESLRVYMITLIRACRRLVYDSYADWLFRSQETEADGEQQSDTGDGLQFGWMGAYLDVASDGLFGTYDQVLDSRFHEVCVHMMRRVDESRRQRQQAAHDHARAMHS